MHRTDILVVTYLPDKPWLECCLRSIKKFASGFNGTVVLVPEDEHAHFTGIAEPGIDVKTYRRTRNRIQWHIQHQLMKCHAESFCQADFILHTDSDCIFTAPVTPETYFMDDKPILPVERYSHMPNRQWQETTSRALGFTAEYETMRRHPAVHYRGMYPEARDFVAGVQKKPFDAYVMSCKPTFPWGISEFNVLGSYVMSSHWKDRYRIMDVEREQVPPNNLMQFWSHWGLTGTITDPGPTQGKRPIDIINTILA